MSIQNLIIYKFIPLYDILEELSLDFNFNISLIEDENSLQQETKNNNNYLIISNKKYSDIGNQFVLDNIPINVSKLSTKKMLKFTFKSSSSRI